MMPVQITEKLEVSYKLVLSGFAEGGELAWAVGVWLTFVHAFKCLGMAFTKRKFWTERQTSGEVAGRKKEATLQKPRDTASGARGDGGPNVYDM